MPVNVKVTELTEDTNPAVNDLLVTVDVSDTTMNASGTNKKVTPANLTKALSAMVGDSGSGGTKGLVPAPAAGDAAASRFLKADGTWSSPSAPPAFDYKDSVRAATTANITLSGEQTIDGVSVVAGDRVLVKNQSTGAENGIYVCAAGAWARAADADSSAEVTAGMFVAVAEGTSNADTFWLLTTNDPITLNTTALSFSQFGVSSGAETGANSDITSMDGLTGALQYPTQIDFTEGAAPGTPAAGKVSLYAKADGLLYSKDDAGTETALGAAGAGYAGVTTGGTGSLDFAQGAKTADEPFVDGSVTWNSGAVTFNAIKLAITDTASVATSNLINLLVGGATVFRVQKQGRVYSAGGNAGAPSFSFEGDTDTGIWSGTANKLSFSTGGAERVSFSESAGEIACDYSNGIKLTNNSAPFRWTSSTRLLAPSSGHLRVDGNSNGTGDRVILGTVDASGAMIKRNSTRLEAKLGGDSAYTQFTCEKLGVNNRAAATTLGSVTGKTEIFDAAGASLGFVPIYDAIT